MHKKLGIDDMVSSQAAIKGYMNFRKENGYRHKARVQISSNGKNRFNDVLYICAVIESKSSYVILEGTDAFVTDFWGTYSFEYQKFRVIGGTLLIQAIDRFGNAIEIDITGV